MPKSRPGDGPKKLSDSFRHWKGIEGGERHHAFIAGDTHWVIGHPSDKGSKPCMGWVTGGKLPCKFCALGKMPCEFGYVPVYRAIDYRPMCVIVYGDEREWVDRCALHDRVQIGREKEPGARLWLRKCMAEGAAFTTTLAYRKCAQSIEDSLLAMWGMPELTNYLRCTPADAPAPIAPAPVVTSSGEEFGPMTRAAAKRAATSEAIDRAKLADFDAVQKRLGLSSGRLKPSTNGKHD